MASEQQPPALLAWSTAVHLAVNGTDQSFAAHLHRHPFLATLQAPPGSGSHVQKSVLHTIVVTPGCHPSAVQHLLDCGADPDALDNLGITPIEYVNMNSQLFDILLYRSQVALSRLLSRVAVELVDQRDPKYSFAKLDQLLRVGADPNRPGASNRSTCEFLQSDVQFAAQFHKSENMRATFDRHHRCVQVIRYLADNYVARAQSAATAFEMYDHSGAHGVDWRMAFRQQAKLVPPVFTVCDIPVLLQKAEAVLRDMQQVMPMSAHYGLSTGPTKSTGPSKATGPSKRSAAFAQFRL
eukprot:TRINITY_DN10770_c0_g1_i1.p1 TRINITY_DN10770_c0_g1~~TRINITY_DN10770_c0_g1_i1.p1  ORF type:complete len:296 (-),score=55.38 TRINITY_DN10770_c0_g1_i1:292-1179(-)